MQVIFSVYLWIFKHFTDVVLFEKNLPLESKQWIELGIYEGVKNFLL